MQLNVSVGGSIAATPAGPRPQPAAPELSQMLAPAEPVPGVTVALSPVAEAMLDGYDAARDGQGSDDPKHNPLGGQALADSMAEVAGQAEPAADRNARSLEALEASIADERDARERSLRDLQRAGRSAEGCSSTLRPAAPTCHACCSAAAVIRAQQPCSLLLMHCVRALICGIAIRIATQHA